MTQIVNLRHHKCDIVCDRTTPFGNPYDHNRLGITREECLSRYKTYFYNKLQDSEFRAKVLTLKNKKLGCWCKCQPHCGNSKCRSYPCHLETIVEWLDNL